MVRTSPRRVICPLPRSRSRSEIVATFIAVLELCREKVIHLAGSDTDCTVECGDDAPDRINL